MGFYRAPSGFLKDLKSIDRELTAIWSDRYDRWQIRQVHRDGSVSHIMTVKEPDGGFRDLDRRTLLTVAKLFSPNYDPIEEMDEHNAKLDASKRRELENNVDAMTDEVWRKVKDIPQFACGGIQ